MNDSNRRMLTTGTLAAALIAVLLPTGCPAMNPTRPVIVTPPITPVTSPVELPQPPGVG
jgi:hypothetical protein